MILGIGVDIIEIDRIAKAFERHGMRFLDRIFTKKEQEYCLSHQSFAIHLAGRFAAKEAIAKALGTGITGTTHFTDFEILNDPTGKPQVHLSSNLKAQFNNPNILISISHSKSHATGFAVWQQTL